MRMLKFIDKSIQVCDESGEAPTLNKFSWMLAGQCQFANCTAVEAKRVLLICKLAELVYCFKIAFAHNLI
jgi:hypothetical protein